jgi:hypothetical protein
MNEHPCKMPILEAAEPGSAKWRHRTKSTTNRRRRTADCVVVQVCPGATEAGYTFESNEWELQTSRAGVPSEGNAGEAGRIR